MDAKKRYEEWLANPYFDDAAKYELKSIACDEKKRSRRDFTAIWSSGQGDCAGSSARARTG